MLPGCYQQRLLVSVEESAGNNSARDLPPSLRRVAGQFEFRFSLPTRIRGIIEPCRSRIYLNGTSRLHSARLIGAVPCLSVGAQSARASLQRMDSTTHLNTCFRVPFTMRQARNWDRLKLAQLPRVGYRRQAQGESKNASACQTAKITSIFQTDPLPSAQITWKCAVQTASRS